MKPLVDVLHKLVQFSNKMTNKFTMGYIWDKFASETFHLDFLRSIFCIFKIVEILQKFLTG